MRIFWMLLAVVPVFGKTQIIFWHALEGFLAGQFSEIVEDFNRGSSEYEVLFVNNGNYTEVFQRGVAAFEKGEPPHILQVYEVATQSMVQMPEMYVPIEEIMRKLNSKFDAAIYLDAVREFYSSEGKMNSFPWNASTGILFYNKEAFLKAGLDPERPPKTWEEVEEFGKKLASVGYLGFTSAWPAAYHLEHLCSLHNLPFASQDNGFSGMDAQLMFNGPLQKRHLRKLVEWQLDGIFSYQGRFVIGPNPAPEALFKSGQCAMLLQGANRVPMLKGNFPIGVGFMPYWSDVEGAPFRLNIGGSSFWVVRGFDEHIYRGIAQFFSFLSRTEIQSYWHEKTGYLPVTEAAYYLSKKRGFYEKNPAAEIAVLEVMNPKSTANTKGIRLPNYIEVRERTIDYLEKAFSGEMAPDAALDEAVREGNQLLQK